MPGKLITFLLLFLFFSCSRQAEMVQRTQEISKEGITLKITSSTDHLRSCDLLELSIEVLLPRDMSAELPGKDTDYGDFTLYQVDPGSQTAISQKVNRLYHVIILEPGLPGEHKLPSLSFKFHQSSGKEITLSTKETAFDVKSVLQSESQPMEDIIITENERKYWLPVIAVILILSPIFYLASIKRTILMSEEEKLEAAYRRFGELQNESAPDIISQLPETICEFLKQKFSRHDLPNNVDVIIRELENSIPENQKKLLKESAVKYDEIRYSNRKTDSSAVSVWEHFDSVLNRMRRNTV